MYFGIFPPEINSGRMYAGPGSGSMVAAAEAWDALAAQLHATAAAYSSVISGLMTTWQGPSSVAMAAAARPYVTWMSTTATEAEQTAAQIRAGAMAYEAAFAATVPPPVVAANRSELASLVATNVFGQNAPAIAATEAQYTRMWARDAVAMSTYASQSAVATTVTPFAEPPTTTNPMGAADQLLQAARALNTSVGSGAQAQASQVFGAVPHTLQSLGTLTANPNPGSGLLTALQDFAGMQSVNSVASDVELIPKLILPANSVLINTIMGLVMGTRGATLAAASEAVTGAAGAGLVSGTQLVDSTGLGAAGPAVSAGAGQAGVIGVLSVPPTWATATPAIRTVAAVLSGAIQGAVPAAAVSEGTLLSGMAVAGMAGGALGAAAPNALSGVSTRLRSTSLKDGSSPDGETPENLQRLVAEMADKPDDVQHWHTDSAGLESLIGKLKKKPGIHAVHLTDDDPNITLPRFN